MGHFDNNSVKASLEANKNCLAGDPMQLSMFDLRSSIRDTWKHNTYNSLLMENILRGELQNPNFLSAWGEGLFFQNGIDRGGAREGVSLIGPC